MIPDKIKEAANTLDVSIINDEIKPGDMYLAMRNTGPRLLTCRKIGSGCIHPVEYPVYSFDTCECFKIEEN